MMSGPMGLNPFTRGLGITLNWGASMKKLIINEKWQEEEISVNDIIFVIVIEDFTNNLHWIWDNSTDEAIARDSFEAAINGFKEINYDYCKVSLVKLPNTSQVKDLIELIGTMPQSNKDLMGELLGRVDCEVLDVYSTKLEEAKKRKKKNNGYLSGTWLTFTTGDPVYNMKQFNKHMGTDFEDQAKDAAKEAAKETAPAIDATVDAGEVSGSSDLGSGNISSDAGAGEAGGGEAAGGDAGAGLGESMDIKEETIIQEDDLYAHVNKSTLNLPDEVKLLSQSEVEAFIKELDPAQLFEVGYITPFTLYSQLNRYFKVLKATVFKGYTGIDYRDVSVGDEEEKARRLARAKQQIADNPNGAHGWALNPDGFSAEYRDQTNKLARNVHKDSVAVINGQVIDMNRLLFYPELGSRSKASYYLGYKAVKTDANGSKYEANQFTWVKLDKKELVDEFLKHFKEFMVEDSKAFTPEEAAWVQKKLGMTMPEFIDKYPGVSVNNYKIATKFGMDPVEYVNKYPFTQRWTLDDLTRKLQTINFASNDLSKLQTTSDELNAHTGLDLEHGWNTNKPQVRALYTNQIFYLSTDGKTLGNRSIVESLEEEIELDEAKRYVKRYYIRPQNVFASNKEEILKALVAAGDQNCSVYSLKNLDDHDDVHLLKPSDIIYYYDDHVLYDKNHVQVMDYDLFVKHEEERKKVADVDAISDTTFNDIYDDRLTDADLTKKEIKVEEPTHEGLEESLDSFNPFTLNFDNVNAYGETLNEDADSKFVCCICGEETTGYGNNPEPVKHEGRCCDACNRKFVIPARIEELNIKDEE